MFGIVNAIFIFLSLFGFIILSMSAYQKIRKDGIISYLPNPIKSFLLSW